ncbi:MAG: YgfZ/GcvT domain-containing protein [Acidimicrobiia bacterium]
MTATPLEAAFTRARATLDLGVEVAGDYGDPAGEYLALRQRAGMVDRCARGAVLVTGLDAPRFLQGLLSQEVAGLADGEGRHCLLLSPQGKLDVDLRLLRVGDDCWLDCEIGYGSRLANSLDRFRIRVRAELADRSASFGVLSVKGPQAHERVAEAAGGVRIGDDPHSHAAWGALRLVRADWPEVPGVDLVGPIDELAGAWESLEARGVTPVGLDAYESVRVEAGIPRHGRDLDESTIPQEAFLERDAVSFTKGCFLGQELVCRIDSRGHVNRFLRGLRLAGTVCPPEGTAVFRGSKQVGSVTSVAPLADPPLVLGFIRREVSPGEEAVLTWSGQEVSAVIIELPVPA